MLRLKLYIFKVATFKNFIFGIFNIGMAFANSQCLEGRKNNGCNKGDDYCSVIYANFCE